jgi:electron transport complex protein RnfC
LNSLHLPLDSGRHLSGHLLRNLPAHPDDVIAATELTLICTAAEEHDSPDACIRCGWCVEACPTRIHPAGLLDAAQQEDPELAHDYGLSSCIDCGICSYVCPSRLPLLESIRGLRNSRTVT